MPLIEIRIRTYALKVTPLTMERFQFGINSERDYRWKDNRLVFI